MSKINKTARVSRNKTYYVFFNMRGKYSGGYARIKANCYDRAKAIAYARFGYQNIGSIESNEEYAQNKVKAFKFVEVEEE